MGMLVFLEKLKGKKIARLIGSMTTREPICTTIIILTAISYVVLLSQEFNESVFCIIEYTIRTYTRVKIFMVNVSI